MKILFLSRLFYPHIGGIETHLEEISKRLITKGHKVTIVTTKHDESLSDSEIYNSIQENPALQGGDELNADMSSSLGKPRLLRRGGRHKKIVIRRFVQPEVKVYGILKTWLWFYKNISLIKESEIIHVHDVFIWYWPFRILFPKKKVYTTFHGRWGKYPIPLKDIIQKRIGARFSDGVMTIGEYINKYYGIRSDIVTYGAANRFRPKAGKDPKLVLYVGRLDRDIALSLIFEVFRQIKGYKKEFCGDGELKKEAYIYGKVHGFVNPEPFYQKAKYCFASGYLTIFEALAHKCLVFVAYANPLQKDYYLLTPFKNFIICSPNSQDLLTKFIYYSKHHAAAEKKIEAGYRWVKDQTWEKMVNNYYKLWGEIK
ncbi:hypothetical protein A2863_02160 [Candidatus Woesebacteria bacterium RIFCSPHIGHO2_01_FULL_38_9b]|uniref:Glycosyltransferase subfamily 4-like N-terminal domain-containing protein n=1 Tax=Candidatus Woesebacteria bacterium RIFCSPHIGHO2_01_FULL_38_9b TaxID=1802493 RepID=A0A1F7Y026_9BACT|nr:MAG: hypothetical protein A2863_02160 [Candidatus Woesebacteria bacterium RIFCSPHIGHO2_01_FULL_38_9b]